MTKMRFIRRFARDDEGATTTDWVVLTAALVGLGVAIATTVASGTDNHATGISQCTKGMGKRMSRDFDNPRWSYERKLERMERACRNWARRS